MNGALNAKSEVDVTDDKIQDYTVTNGVSYFFPSSLVFSLRNRAYK